MKPFLDAPEFIESDNRRFRDCSPVSIQQMTHKHEVLFPAALVKDKSVLDLGCALGSTGHWCLSLGAREYIGVEAQETYALQARRLLDKHHPGQFRIQQVSIEQYLDTASDTYDIVSMLGVIYVFTDYYSILEKTCSLARETVIIEAMYPFGSRFREDFVGVQFLDKMNINLADENASLVGRGSRLSPLGLEFIMKDFGFKSVEGRLYPAAITESLDVYNNINVHGPRYLMRFTRTGELRINLSQDLTGKREGSRDPWTQPI